MELKKARRSEAKARIAFSGPSGSGKTMSSLLVAYGLCKDWNKIAIIDTENKSGELYANYNQRGINIGEYNALTLTAPFTPERYIEAIKTCEKAGMEVIIIDSLTHAWTGEGGLLDLQGKIVDSGKANSYTAWRYVTPKHNALVETILQSNCHIIATIRAKTEYIQTIGNNGKTEIKKVGLAPIQREGMEYEFTIFFDLDIAHNASTSKDRTGIFDGLYFIPSIKTGEEIRKWLDSNLETYTPTAEEIKINQPNTPQETKNEELALTYTPTYAEKLKWCIDKSNTATTEFELQTAWQEVKESKNYTSLTETDKGRVRRHFNAKKEALKTENHLQTV